VLKSYQNMPRMVTPLLDPFEDGRGLTPDQRRRLGRAIRAKRITAGLDQDQVAARLKLAAKTYGLVERGKPVSVRTLLRVLAYFKATIPGLLDGQGASAGAWPDGLNSEDAHIARAYHDAESEVRAAVRQLLTAPWPLPAHVSRWLEDALLLDLEEVETHVAHVHEKAEMRRRGRAPAADQAPEARTLNSRSIAAPLSRAKS